jgi:hypothetical protein
MSRQSRQTAHEKSWNGVHPVIKNFLANFYRWADTSGNQNYIGAEALAFTDQMLPLYEWKGPGEVVARQLLCTAPQVYVQHVVKPTGLAGIAAGQGWQGMLIDNPNSAPDLQPTIV